MSELKKLTDGELLLEIRAVEDGYPLTKEAARRLFARLEELAELRKQLDRERNTHAELQAKCYEGYPTHWSVFDEVNKLRKQLAEAKGWLKHYERGEPEAWKDLKAELTELRKQLEQARTYKGIEGYPCPLCNEAADRITELEDLLFAKGQMMDAPCFCCGYNGPGYYQPATHPCAKRHHESYTDG